MWQNLLAERFDVMLHHESKEFQVEDLMVAKSGHRLKETAVDPAAELEPGPPKFKDNELIGPGFVTTFVFLGQPGLINHGTMKHGLETSSEQGES